ncbi:MAG TPA: small acid-soluble spore protein SspI [Mollicutes bacterium]|nr:small acid-soluble spore protein SspI [Mollicutes bacterium]
MEIDIRKSIMDNFKDADQNEIKQSIVSSIEINDEITLPGLGVFFEILWKNSDENSQEFILNTLSKGIEK